MHSPGAASHIGGSPWSNRPKAGYGYLEAAAHFAAESSTGTNVEVCTTDDFTKGVDALVYHADEATQDMRIAYPLDLFDRNMIERDSADGPVYHQDWLGMKPTTPIISGGMNALRLPGFFENLGHGNLINTAGGGSYGHIDGPAAGARSLRQAYECWKAGADPIAWAKEHNEFARAFESFPFDADKLFPGWRDALGTMAATA